MKYKNIWKSLLNIIVILTILLLTTYLNPQISVMASSTDAVSIAHEYTLEDFGIQADETIQGILVNATFGLIFPTTWTYDQDALLNLKFSHSPALNPTSSMTIDWNTERIGSILLTPENADEALLQLSIPSKRIKPGYNALQVQFYMGISEDFCDDYDNPAVWAVIHKQSSIEISPKIEATNPDLGMVPEILIDSSPLVKNHVTFIVPEKPSLNILNALAVMSAKLGEIADWREIETNTMTLTEAHQQQPKGHIIAIATIDDLPKIHPKLAPQVIESDEKYFIEDDEGQLLSPQDGLLFLNKSPFDEMATIFSITGLTDEAVEKSARAAAYDDLYPQLNGPIEIIKSIPEDRFQNNTQNNSISFESLGYSNSTAYGTREQTINYNLPLTALWQLKNEAELNLNISYSALLNSERSTLSLIVNSIPVSSVSLPPENANNRLVKFRIPLQYLNIGNNSITFKTNLQYTEGYLETQQYCTDDAFLRAWLTIRSDSNINFPEIPKTISANISNFPYSFFDGKDFSKFSFVLTKDDHFSAVKTMSQTATTLGTVIKGNAAQINVAFTTNKNVINDFQNLIIIGSAKQNPILPMINPILPLSFDINTGQPESNPAIISTDADMNPKGYIQIFRTQNNNLNLFITSSSPKALENAGEILNTPSVQSELKGDLAIVSAPDRASAIWLDESEMERTHNELASQQNTSSTLRGQSIWVTRSSIGILILSAASLVIAYIQLRRKQTGEEQKI